MKNLLVLCTGNSCRSQIAEAYLRIYANGRFNVYSAGVETHGLNPRAVATMAADGVDISMHKSQLVDDFLDMNIDYVLTVCDHAAEVCPMFPAKATVFHHSFNDPAKATGTEEEIMAEFHRVRDEIKTYCKEFIEQL